MRHMMVVLVAVNIVPEHAQIVELELNQQKKKYPKA